MADEHNALTVSVAPDASTTQVSVDGSGAIGKPKTTGDSLTLNTADEALEADLKAVDAQDGDEPDAPAEDAPAAETPEDEPAAPELDTDLPDFDPASDEVRTAYDAKYLTEVDGKQQLNLNAFNAEAEAHMAAGKLDINKGSREYIKDLMGIDDAGIDTYLSGLESRHTAKVTELYTLAGGSEAYESMLGWARGTGGYDAEAQAKFNSAVTKGGEEAETAIALLKSRFERAGGKVASKASVPSLGLRNRRPSSPARKADGQPAVSKVEGFKDQEAHRVAMLEAGSDNSKVEAVRKRLRASSWFNQK